MSGGHSSDETATADGRPAIFDPSRSRCLGDIEVTKPRSGRAASDLRPKEESMSGRHRSDETAKRMGGKAISAKQNECPVDIQVKKPRQRMGGQRSYAEHTQRSGGRLSDETAKRTGKRQFESGKFEIRKWK